jgi:hypothetical protein
MEEWYYIELSYATFGIAAEDGVVTKAAPIAAWSIGKTLKQYLQWVEKKKGKAIKLDDHDDS